MFTFFGLAKIQKGNGDKAAVIVLIMVYSLVLVQQPWPNNVGMNSCTYYLVLLLPLRTNYMTLPQYADNTRSLKVANSRIILIKKNIIGLRCCNFPKKNYKTCLENKNRCCSPSLSCDARRRPFKLDTVIMMQQYSKALPSVVGLVEEEVLHTTYMQLK